MTTNRKDCTSILKKLATDNVSSSMQICLSMLECAKRLFNNYSLKDLIYNIVINQSSMAAVINTGLKIIEALDKKDTDAINSINKEILNSSSRAIKSASEFLYGIKNLATISFSKSILELINLIKPENVYLSVAHPSREGEKLAALLKKESISPVLIEDCAYSLILKEVEAVIVGADAIFDNSFINKTGTLTLALLSKHFNIPFYVIGCRCKYLDINAQRFFRITQKPEDEISNVDCKKINRYFEEIPINLVNKIFVG